MKPVVLAVIPARAGSKGLPGKCVALVGGRPLIEHTILNAKAAKRIDAICVTTDSCDAAAVARRHGVFVMDRPPELATDTAPVDAALRHAVDAYECAHAGFHANVVVLLYGNIPIRADGIIDAAIDKLLTTACDSVRTLAPVGKHHPDWLHRLDGDRMTQFRHNVIHRRQDLEPLYFHDGAVVVVTRASLFSPPNSPDDHHAFFGCDRRGIVQPADAAVDVDTPLDLHIAEAILRHQSAGDTRESAELRIADRVIGRDSGVFIIAEAGVNHDGDPALARRLVEAARAAGADAVKFQAFSADRLVSRTAAACDYQEQHTDAASQHEMLQRLELAPAQFEALRDTAAACGIVFLATPFGLEELDMLVGIGLPAIKLASTDLTNVPLVTAAAQSGRAILMSTGAADLSEVQCAVDLVRRFGAYGRLALLHCVSRYPTPQADANLRAIATLHAHFGRPVGFSDHTPDVDTGALAVAAGAVILEKHLTLDRALPGPDNFFSLTPDEFTVYVVQARRAAAALGRGRIECDAGQQQARRLARGSIVAKSDICRGTTLAPELLIVRRPADGIDPAEWPRVLGRTAKQDIAGGALLTWTMLA